ncbi:hypothetical protein BDQ17DRAFT_1404533 [Cyathus striatus]|nr:hypothetical protein BDQ17DRAFT_1404533 [Cyathus striatus]
MTIAIPAATIRGSTPKVSPSFVRCRSTAALSSSIVDAKSRVREHARNISRTTISNATAAPSVRPSPAPGFQQVPTPNNTRFPPNLTGPAPNAPLDHSFVGLTGGEIFHEMMLRHDVKHIFGYPGGAILPVFDAIYKSPYFDFVLPRHEQGAGHMAEGYARVSGKPGVVLVTSGPGATNVVTPMQDALSDGVPLVVFTGQVATSAIGSDAFQEADIVGISRSCTKWNVMVKDISELPRRINEAFKIATSGRPGPVLVDLPKDVTAGILRTPLPFKATTPGINLGLPANPLALPESPVDEVSIRQAAQMINQAQRPVIYAGNGVLSSPAGPKLLAALAEQGNIPVCTTLQGLGAFDETNDKSLHMLGMHGSAYANLAMQQADVIIALGGRFDDRVTGKVDTFAPAARAAALQGRGGVIHFEIQPKNINKVLEAQIPILGDVVTNLASLVPLIEHSPREDWFKDIRSWKKDYPFTYSRRRRVPDKPQQHQMWAAQFFRWKHPRTMVTSGGLGTMGFGLPAAIGAKHWRKILILNNEFQGMVLQWQDLFYEKRYSHTQMTNPDFILLARAMGVQAIRCSSAEELPEKMKEFLEYDNTKPILMECVVEKNEHVFPMVPAGKALHEQMCIPHWR